MTRRFFAVCWADLAVLAVLMLALAIVVGPPGWRRWPLKNGMLGFVDDGITWAVESCHPMHVAMHRFADVCAPADRRYADIWEQVALMARHVPLLP